MTDLSTYYTPLNVAAKLGVNLLNMNAGFARMRQLTPVSYSSGPQTLAGTADTVVCDTSGGNFTVNLPADPDNDEPGAVYRFVNVSATGTLTIGRSGNLINTFAGDVNLSDQHIVQFMKWTGDPDFGWLSFQYNPYTAF